MPRPSTNTTLRSTLSASAASSCSVGSVQVAGVSALACPCFCTPCVCTCVKHVQPGSRRHAQQQWQSMRRPAGAWDVG